MSYPRVSAILRDLGFTNAWGSAYHLARGTGLHRAIQMDLLGTLDEATVHPDIQPGFTAWRAFRAQARPSLIQAECELVDPTWRFTGHPDLIAWISGRATLVDYKYTESPDLPYCRLQLAAYAHLWEATRERALSSLAYPSLSAAFVLQLTPSGRFQLHPLTLTDLIEPRQDFLAAVRVWHALQARRKPTPV